MDKTLVFDSLNAKAVAIILGGGIGVVRTDTLYGIVGLASNEAAVQKVFDAKQRTPTKSPIVLISSASQLFDTYNDSTHQHLDSQWPGPVSIILPSSSDYSWLTRGNKSIAYRLPAAPELCNFIDQTGPLIAPSANPEGLPPATTIAEAIDYFGSTVDFYIDSGAVTADQPPSQLWRYNTGTGESERLR